MSAQLPHAGAEHQDFPLGLPAPRADLTLGAPSEDRDVSQVDGQALGLE